MKFSNEIKVDRRLGQCDPIHENTDHDLHHDFANVNDPRDSHNKPQDVSSEVVANMFYQHATLGSNGEDYIFDDFVNLHHRLNLKLLQFDEKETSAISTQNHNNRNHNNHNHNHNKHTNNQTSQSQNTTTNSSITNSPIIQNTSKSKSSSSSSYSSCVIS